MWDKSTNTVVQYIIGFSGFFFMKTRECYVYGGMTNKESHSILHLPKSWRAPADSQENLCIIIEGRSELEHSSVIYP